MMHGTSATSCKQSLQYCIPKQSLGTRKIPPTALDFERSEFYITDMLSTPIAPVTINSYEEWLTTLERANAGELEGGEEFSSIAYKRLYFRAGHTPEVELFRLERLCVTTYISTRFKDALRLAGITGLEIRHNRRLFFPDLPIGPRQEIETYRLSPIRPERATPSGSKKRQRGATLKRRGLAAR